MQQNEQRKRSLRVIKARGMGHASDPHLFTIGARGFHWTSRMRTEPLAGLDPTMVKGKPAVKPEKINRLFVDFK
jgi:hypothetical protein